MSEFERLVEAFMRAAEDVGMVVDRDVAASEVRKQVNALAEALAISPEEASDILDEEHIRAFVHEVAFVRVDEQPGAELLSLPRHTPMSTSVLGTAVAATAKALEVLAGPASAESQGVVRDLASSLMALGVILREDACVEAAGVPSIGAPAAVGYRLSWALGQAAQIAEQLAATGDSDDPNVGALAGAFSRDADELRSWADEASGKAT